MGAAILFDFLLPLMLGVFVPLLLCLAHGASDAQRLPLQPWAMGCIGARQRESACLRLLESLGVGGAYRDRGGQWGGSPAAVTRIGRNYFNNLPLLVI